MCLHEALRGGPGVIFCGVNKDCVTGDLVTARGKRRGGERFQRVKGLRKARVERAVAVEMF